MRIEAFLNINEHDFYSKKFNILIGISLGNKYFSEENIKNYLLWALENTKDKVAILIPDKIHSVNYEVKSRYSKGRAEKLALREGKKIKNFCENTLSQINPEKWALVEILSWENIETDEHNNMAVVLREEFGKNKKFKNLIIEIVKESIQSTGLTDFDYEKLSAYPLEELPILISGIEYRGTRYNLLPYPGVSKIDHLAIDLQEGKNFPEITEKLNIKEKLGLVEVYV